MLEKRRNDFFRHWLLGLGAGDLHVKTGGAGNLDIEDSAEIMVEVLTEHMRRSPYPSSVLIVAETALEEQVLRSRLQSSS